MTTPITVLVIDDSAGSRRVLVEQLEAEGDLSVIGRAADGRAGLERVLALRPDVVTLDLEMPGLDGFALLRLLMARAPTPVVVTSSYAHPSDSLQALELGAVDFVAKPSISHAAELAAYGAELREKVRAASQARPREPATRATPEPALRVVGIGASTGGPPAIQQLLTTWTDAPGLCVLIAQHMPAPFTRAFAERLDRLGGLSVAEAHEGAPVRPGRVWVAPGGRHLEVERGRRGALQLRLVSSGPGERHVPSVDRLFSSMAAALGSRALGLVLTGMGQDGARGTRALAQVGAEVWAESEDSAVVHGMPAEAIATGGVSRVLPLAGLGSAVRRWAAESGGEAAANGRGTSDRRLSGAPGSEALPSPPAWGPPSGGEG
jgi:two-component system chemotaxis response regulator CheB